VFYVWTKDKFFMFSYSIQKENIKINILKNSNNPENLNPYGRLPFVTFYDDLPVDSFFSEGGDDLIIANEINNIKLTEKNHLTKMQSFSLLVRKSSDQTKNEIILDPSMTIDIPADSDIAKNIDLFYVTPDAKIQELENDITNRMNRIATKYKLNPEMFKASGHRSSADALQMQTYYLSKSINSDKENFRACESELFDLMRTVYNYHTDQNLLNESFELFVDYEEVETPVTLEQRDAHNVILFTNGLLSKKDWMMAENKDIKSAEQAEAKLEEINEENKEAVLNNPIAQMQGEGKFGTQEEDDQKEEDNPDNPKEDKEETV
jgi:hypothetical protein